MPMLRTGTRQVVLFREWKGGTFQDGSAIDGALNERVDARGGVISPKSITELGADPNLQRVQPVSYAVDRNPSVVED